MKLLKYILPFLFVMLGYQMGSYSQYIPSYLKNAKPTTVKRADSLAMHPGRKKLLQTIQGIDTNKSMEKASWGVMVMEVASGKVIAAHNEKLLLTPASLMKAVTTGVGYLQLGSDFRFSTKLFYSGKISQDSVLKGDLIILAGGDPSICCFRWNQTHPDTVFQFFSTQIKSHGIKKVDGKLILDLSRFDDMQSSPNWNWGDMGNYFGAGSSALSFNENIIHFWLTSKDSVGMSTTIDSIYPKLSNIEIRNFVESGLPNSGDNANIYSSAIGNIIELRGTIPAGKSSFLLKGANFHPEKTFANELTSYFNSNGIELNSDIIYLDFRSKIDTNAERTLIATYFSPTFHTLASFTNKTSHNMFAESFLKELGRQRFGVGSYWSGVRAIDISLARMGIPQSEIINVDGSGLSRLNLTTPFLFCKFFSYLSKSNSFQNFYKSLPEAAESGTISRMFKGSVAARNLRAKSGSIERVRSYGGYVTNRKGKLLTFAILVNNFTEKQSTIVAQLEKLMIAIAESD